jgi:hypothetical protein
LGFGEKQMDITAIPFNQLVGIKRAERDPPHLLELHPRQSLTNHLGTVHAVAQLALAEASSGEFLLRAFKGDGRDAVALVRSVQAKFRKPLQGRAYSVARVEDGEIEKLSRALDAKGRGVVSVQVDIIDDQDVVTMSAEIGWFIQQRDHAGPAD